MYFFKIKRSVWYVGCDGTEWDEAFRLTFGAPKTGETRCFTGRILGEFSLCLTPWNDSFHICGTQNYNLFVSFFFLLVSTRGHPCFLFVPSRPVSFSFISSYLVCIPNDTL
ncbi:unnamed protein product [Malus baccata var. baccata]